MTNEYRSSCRKCFLTMAQAHLRRSYHNGEMWYHPPLILVRSLTMTICLASPSTVSRVWAGMTCQHYPISNLSFTRNTLCKIVTFCSTVLAFNIKEAFSTFEILIFIALPSPYSVITQTIVTLFWKSTCASCHCYGGTWNRCHHCRHFDSQQKVSREIFCTWSTVCIEMLFVTITDASSAIWCEVSTQ